MNEVNVTVLRRDSGNLSYPVKVATEDSHGNVLSTRVVESEDEAIDDNVLLAAEMRADILRSDPEVRAGAVKFLQGILDDEDTDAQDRAFHIAVLRGVEAR